MRAFISGVCAASVLVLASCRGADVLPPTSPFAAVAITAADIAFNPATYTAVDISAGLGNSRATAINNAGTTAGIGVINGVVVPWSRTRAGALTLLAMPAGRDRPFVHAMSDAGLIVGHVNWGGDHRAILWQPDGTALDLGTLFGDKAVALGINRDGDIVGESTGGGGPFCGFIRPASTGVMVPLPACPSYEWTSATSISDDGTIIGHGRRSNGYDALMWPSASSQPVKLADPFNLAANAVVISRNGEYIAGNVFDPGLNRWQLTVWTKSTGWQPTVIPQEWNFDFVERSSPLGINSSGIVVGQRWNIAVAFGWSAQTGSLNLSNQQSAAFAISDAGSIAGYLNFKAERWDPSDVTAPIVSPTVSGSLGLDGWYTSDVTVSWTTTDPESGIASTTDCGTVTLTSNTAGVTYMCTAINGVGLSASASVTIKRDDTPPVVAFSGAHTTYDVNEIVSIGCSASDSMSGIATSDCPSLFAPAYAVGAGSHTLLASASDNAGNSASASVTFAIVVSASGFCALASQWADNAGVANSLCVKAKLANRKALLNELDAQSGKHVPADKATILRALALSLP